MHGRKHVRGNRQNPYSPDYHLSRAVQCRDCGVFLHKDHRYVWYGNRCPGCYQVIVMAGGGVCK